MITAPMQGLPNALVYFYPRIRSLRQQHPNTPWYEVVGLMFRIRSTCTIHQQEDGEEANPLE